MTTKIENNDKLATVLFYCIVLSLIPIFITSIINPNFSQKPLYYLMVGGIFFLQVIIMYYHYRKSKKNMFNKRLVILSLVFMISQMITILLLFINGVEGEILDLLNVLIRFISILIFMCIPFGFSISKKALQKFMVRMIILGIIACLYNMIINFRGMVGILNINNPYAVNFKSFFIGRNSFAQLLFFCIIANTFLLFNEKNFFCWFSYFIFIINMIATLSRTVIASSCIFILMFIIIYFRKKNIAKSIFFIFSSIIVLIITSNSKIMNFITKILIRNEVGTTGRSLFWNVGFEILNQTSWFWGTGYLTSRMILKDKGYSSQFHNFYIETLVGGGLIDLFFHLVIFIFIIKRIITIFRNDRVTGAIYISGYMGLIFYAFFESASFFSMGYVDSIFRIFFITLPLMYSNNFVIQEKNKLICKNRRYNEINEKELMIQYKQF